ncbi:hypothetical protein AUCHE_12_00070 [Austwickia chelonae NBRC 105200]|uniref:Uncharacterized protein n=1 Tax=Austwickia chelonae NBRC 105200 TaxID=1184607 RepID=K6W9R4_9MICO|nr:hypothetical protein AUCHE_12_00070 [Austwickia chelonae NBRC 105200]
MDGLMVRDPVPEGMQNIDMAVDVTATLGLHAGKSVAQMRSPKGVLVALGKQETPEA